MFNKIILSSALLITLGASLATAQTTPAQNSKEPIEITADQSLEWHRNDKKFIARKNAQAVQGDVSINAATLTADYVEGEGQNMKINRVQADNDVRIRSRDSDAYGDKGIYEIDKGYAELTGSDLRLISPDQTVTARDKFEYWVVEGKLIAIGNARLIRKNEQGETNTLDADTITAYLKDDANGKRVLDRMVAVGNVVITTPTETLTGAQGTYEARSNTAEIAGDVEIKRGPNILEGSKATVDLNTSISRMFGGGRTGRVKATFFPGSEKKDEPAQNSAPAPAPVSEQPPTATQPQERIQLRAPLTGQ